MTAAYWIVIAVVALPLLAFARDQYRYRYLVRKAVALQDGGNPLGAQRILQQVVARGDKRPVTADSFDARFQLALSYLSTGRHDAAVVQLRKLAAFLEHHAGATIVHTGSGAGRTSVEESEVRGRLAEALTAVGRTIEAAAERERALRVGEENEAESAAAAPPRAPARSPLRQRGGAGENQATPRPQAAALRLPVAPPRPAPIPRTPAGAPRRGPAVVATPRPAASTLAQHRAADPAEQERERAIRTAFASGRKEQAARMLVVQAQSLLRRGELSAASAASAQASRYATLPQARLMQADALRLQGNFEAARVALQQARDEVPPADANHEGRRAHAVVALSQAWVEAEAGRAQAALDALSEAAVVLGNEPGTFGLLCQATTAWVQSLLGDHAAAAPAVAAAEVAVRRAASGADPAAKPFVPIVFALLARAVHARGDDRQCLEYVARCLAEEPDPVFRPTAWRLAGECHRRLNNSDAARLAFEQAVATGMDTRDARLARERLDELTIPVPAG